MGISGLGQVPDPTYPHCCWKQPREKAPELPHQVLQKNYTQPFDILGHLITTTTSPLNFRIARVIFQSFPRSPADVLEDLKSSL